MRADGCGPEPAATRKICGALPFYPSFFTRDVNRRPAAHPRLANHHNRFWITFSCAITDCLGAVVCYRYGFVSREKRRTMKPVGIAILACAIASAGCAKRPENITPRFASAASYRQMACQQLNDERMRVGLELQRITALQRENANADAVFMTVGAIVFFPALIALAATTDRADEIAAMMGERDAMEIAAREKNCPAVNIPAPPPEPTPPQSNT